MFYANDFNADQLSNKAFTDEEECVVFDPDNIHESSTNLSDFLKQYQREDWTPKGTRKLRKTAWAWTDDENDTNNNLSLLDIGYSSSLKSKSANSSDGESGNSRKETDNSKRQSEILKKDSDSSREEPESSRDVSGKCFEYRALF